MAYNIVIALAVFLVLIAAAYLLVPKDNHRDLYIVFISIAVLIRIIMVFYLYRVGPESFGTDGLLYHQEGIKIAQQLNSGVPFNMVNYSYTWYTVFIGIVYYLFGINRYIISFINIIFTCISALLLLRIAINHGYKFIQGAFISLVFFYLPNMFLWTSDSRKEASLILVCILFLYSVQNLIKSFASKQKSLVKSAIYMILICFLIYLATLIRVYMFAPLCAGLFISLALLFRKTKDKTLLAYVAIIVLYSMVLFFLVANPLTRNYHAVAFPTVKSDNIAQEISTKAERINEIVSKRSIVESMVNYLLLPYPGNVDFADIKGNYALKLLLGIDMIFWYTCLALMLTGIYSAIRKKNGFYLGLLAFTAIYIIINALVVENVADTIMRYRSVIVGPMLLFIDLEWFSRLVSRFLWHTNRRYGSYKYKIGTISSYSVKR